MTDTDAMTAQQEATFRAAVPLIIGDVIVLEITRWLPAAGPSHACAEAVGYRSDSAHGCYSTHTVIHDHHRQTWLLKRGHYDLPTRQAAQQDVMTR